MGHHKRDGPECFHGVFPHIKSLGRYTFARPARRSPAYYSPSPFLTVILREM
jgi:hypothetical protein